MVDQRNLTEEDLLVVEVDMVEAEGEDLDPDHLEDAADDPEADLPVSPGVAQPAGLAAGAGAKLQPLAAVPDHMIKMEQMPQTEFGVEYCESFPICGVDVISSLLTLQWHIGL